MGRTICKNGIKMLVIAASFTAFGANLVENARFERMDANGGAAKWQGWDGRWSAGPHGAVLFENSPDAKNRGNLYQRLNVRSGRRYRFSYRMKAVGYGGEAFACVEWYGTDGKCLGGRGYNGVGGTTDWIERSEMTPPLPDNMGKMIVQLCCTTGDGTGKVYLDDVTLSEAPIVDGIYSSRYRNRAADGEVRFAAALNALDADMADYKSEFVVVDPENPKRERRIAGVVSNRAASVVCCVSDLAQGVNIVRFDLTKDGRTESASLVFERVTPEEEAAPAVRIDEFGRTVVDGKPFFPLGMYWMKVNERDLDVYREAPFNCLMPYDPPNRSEMDLCASKGLKVLYNVKGKDLSEGVESSVIRRFRRHPALLAWYLNAEPPTSRRDDFARSLRFAELGDPDHPGWVALCNYKDVRSYLPMFDVVGTDPYPLYRWPIGMVTEWTRSTREGLMGLKPMWQIPQVCDKGAYPVNRKNCPEACRPPTFDDMRNMAWQCLAGGANGLVFFSFHDLVIMDSKTPFRERWEDVKRMAIEIKSYEDYFLSADVPPSVICSSDAVVCRAWRRGGKTLLVAVNTTREPQTVDVVLDGRKGSLCLGPAEVKIRSCGSMRQRKDGE